jgi:hypothetical protein
LTFPEPCFPPRTGHTFKRFREQWVREVNIMPQVKCSVANCHYWKEGNNCGADLIMIDLDRHADAELDQEFAGESFSVDYQGKAKDSTSTCCHTFKPKHA